MNGRDDGKVICFLPRVSNTTPEGLFTLLLFPVADDVVDGMGEDSVTLGIEGS
jgi:hypothetical protein